MDRQLRAEVAKMEMTTQTAPREVQIEFSRDAVPDGVEVVQDDDDAEAEERREDDEKSNAAGEADRKAAESEALTSAPSARALDENGMAWVPESQFEALVEKTAKLNRRAAKLGCPPIVVEQVEERFIPILKQDHSHNDPVNHPPVIVGYKREVHVRVAGAAPQLAGWTFVARLQHSEGGNIVSKAPSERSIQLDENLWLVDPVCEHCKTKRARKDTFILRESTTGSLRQVGRNCLADFLRTADVEMALGFWKFLHEVELLVASGSEDDFGFGGGGGGGGRTYDDLDDVLCAAAAAIRVEGWRSRAAEREAAERGERRVSTANTVEFLLHPPFARGNESVNDEIRAELKRFDRLPADTTVAEGTKEWIRRRLDPQSDYERNLKVALTGDFIDPRNLGLVVSAVQARLRLVREAEGKLQPEKRPSQHVGEIGKRLRDLPVKVVSTRQIVNDVTGWTSTLVVFETEDGDQLKWFATGEHEFTIGSKVSLTGTVKKHDEWKGTKATLLNRCVVEEAP